MSQARRPVPAQPRLPSVISAPKLSFSGLLIEIFALQPRSVQTLLLRECSNELNRLLVYGPRCLPFRHRGFFSLRHPRTTFIVWERKLAMGIGSSKVGQTSRLYRIDPANNALFAAEQVKWSRLAQVYGELLTAAAPMVSTLLAGIRNDPDVIDAIQRFWCRMIGRGAYPAGTNVVTDASVRLSQVSILSSGNSVPLHTISSRRNAGLPRRH